MLIGLTGHSGAHKTVVAKRLERAHGFRRMHVGKPVKDGYRKAFGLKKRQVDGDAKDKPQAKLGGKTHRAGLEMFGLGIHKATPRATAIALHRRLVKKLAKGDTLALPKALKKHHVVVDGVRSPEEEKMIRALGGEIWRADDGKAHNPDMPMDTMQSGIKADRTIPTHGKKGEIRARVDDELMRCME